jgi:cytochrome c oxidase subunit 4
MSDSHVGHISPVSTYMAIFGSLMVLTAITVIAAFIDMGPFFSNFVAVAIATTKATLVVLFFMHVLYSGPLIKVIIYSGIFWVMIMITLTMMDILSRDLVKPLTYIW